MKDDFPKYIFPTFRNQAFNAPGDKEANEAEQSFSLSYSRATSTESALWSVAKAGARKADFQDLSNN